ncbi:hypothetical protein SLS58_004179 [Diplodia intermedia]|uniref:Uncharacterized protein n=1 Tax=Diplodia intermedia TaxID=856260 RepID=A0ABR3TV31_9PEZI
MQHLIHLHTPRLITRQRRARSKRAAALHLLDPAVAQPVATTEDYENLRARLSFENGGGSGGGPRAAGQWRWLLSGEEAVMGREGDDRRGGGGGQRDMWAMARGPWRFNARGSAATALALQQQGAEDRRVDAAAAAAVDDGAAGEDGWEVLEVGDVRRDMDLDVGSVGGGSLADVRRSGKGMMAVWV